MTNKLKIKTLFLFFFLLTVSIINAQNDIILKNNGDEMKGKVIKINSSDVQFVYQNENVEYTISKADIVKITFGSGRVEFFNSDKNSKVKLEDHHNKVAVLPFGYIKDLEVSNVTMTKKIQQETYAIFKKKSVNLKFQDPSTTNALLSKAGVRNDNIEGYTMGEICNILSVEYVIQGMVSVEKSTVTNFTNTTSNSKHKHHQAYVDKKGHIVGDIWNDDKVNRNANTFSSSTQNYSTNITMNVYNDKGENLYSEDHTSFWLTEDAYKITLTYLAKRTSLYKK